MPCRIVVPRLSERATATAANAAVVDPPAVTGLRIVFGVGPSSEVAPTHATFRPTYSLAIPIFSVGGLDPDGVYEFDATQLLHVLATRSLRRQWGVRLELELTQSPETVGRADICIEAPYDEQSGLALHILGPTGVGTTTPGGGRTVTVATTPVTTPKTVPLLAGVYVVQLRDTDPSTGAKAQVASIARGINVDTTRFEFEG